MYFMCFTVIHVNYIQVTEIYLKEILNKNFNSKDKNLHYQ